MKYDSFGNRMKKYENITRNYLTPRTPVIIRIDGKAFHTFTKGFDKPFDDALINTMQETMKYLCRNIQGCVLGYTQSDEISLLLIDYKKLNSNAWFDNNIQKMASISASMATMIFPRMFQKEMDKINNLTSDDFYYDEKGYMEVNPLYKDKKLTELWYTYSRALEKGAMFDSRVFNIPKEEVTNYFLWRQNDATRNSIQMVGQANFSHKELQGKSCNQIQEMLWQEKGINWNDYPIYQKRGSCCVKSNNKEGLKTGWYIDNGIPIFKNEGRKYIEDLVWVGEE